VVRLDLDDLDETEFEEFCFDLLGQLGFVNVDWRKGTGLPTSPADRGRDIEADLERTDVDEARHLEKWFVDPKHYKRGVPPEAVQGLLAWATAERPHVALIIASNFLSNATKDYLRNYERNNRPPFRIKYWERPTLERFLSTGLRSENEIIDAEQEFFDRVWYERHLTHVAKWDSGEESISDEARRIALDAAERVKARRPDLRASSDDFEWGMWNGKLSALRWVLGDEWDSLDT
jgi:Restriction endonuclease